MSEAASENRDRFNTEAAGDLAGALRLYNELAHKEQSGGTLDAGEREARNLLLNTIYAQRQLVLITPDAVDGDIHTQLVSADKKDKVHPVGTEDDLRAYRLGTETNSRQAYALVVPAEDGVTRQVLAVIYTHWSTQPMGPAGVTPADLPGKVDEILKDPSHPLDEKPNTVIFYSISSFMPRAGQMLIEDLHSHIMREAHGQPMALSTLSPLRTLKKYVTETAQPGSEMTVLDDEELKGIALEYMLANRDPVQKFHLSNGAYVGDINLHANDDGSADMRDGLGVMMNYVYPTDPAILERNKATYKQGIIPLHPDLYGLLESGANAVPVSATGRAVNGNDPAAPRPS
jgi:hypothetical protein